MNTNYEVGKIYDLAFANTIVKDGVQYIVVTDGNKEEFTVRPYEYQVEYSSYPHTIPCFVRKIGIYGKPYFEQSKEDVLKDRYFETGVVHEFTVADVCIDPNTNVQFYSLSDEFGITHRYYPSKTEKLKKSGETITLLVNGIVSAQAGKNNARLDLEAYEKATGAVLVYSTAGPVYPVSAGKTNFGTENEKREFKSSIVYPAGETTANIDKQLGIICRSIAGFMNANGGTLYIGVSDSGYICGIEDDYCHLNDGADDYRYNENDDHYMLKITNRICDSLGRIAGTLINMRIEKGDGKKYCVIDIQKASRPIWFDGNKLFVRIITTNRRLSGDEITQFVLNRVSKNSFKEQKEKEEPSYVADPALPAAEPAPDIKPAKPTHTVRAAQKAWRIITFYDNGDWSFQTDELHGDDVVCNTVIPCDAKRNSLILILAYENGHVEATRLSEILYGRNGLLPEGSRRGRGLFAENGKVVSVFCVRKKDMLLLTSEIDGEKYVKALDVNTLGIHDNMGKGNGIVREKGAVLVNAISIPDDVGTRVALKGSGIFIESNQKYTKGGVKLSSLAPQYRHLINELANVGN